MILASQAYCAIRRETMIKCIEMSGQFGGDIQHAARAHNRKFGTVWKFQTGEEELLHWSLEGGGQSLSGDRVGVGQGTKNSMFENFKLQKNLQNNQVLPMNRALSSQ